MFHEFKDNLGYIVKKVNEEDISVLIEEVNEMQTNNFKDCHGKNSDLAGNIEHEYVLHKSVNQLSQLVLPLCDLYNSKYQYNRFFHVLNKNVPFKLISPWINFQKKGEYNPVHSHAGVYSFVLWLKIPYYLENELKNKSSRYSNSNYPGHFVFHYTNTLGMILNEFLPCQKEEENTLIFFPSKLSHSVNPFFTSDDYRITVSGNILLNVD